MSWLCKEEIDLQHYCDAAVVYWPIVTSRPHLRIDLVEYDREDQVGLIWYRDSKPPEPKVDPESGTFIWVGYEWTVTLVRRVNAHQLELPEGVGALVGQFPDRYRGRWLVFAPASRTPARELLEPPARTRPGSDPNASERQALAPGGQLRPSAEPTSSGASDSDWLGG